MKKNIIYLIAAGCLLLGIIFSILALATVGWDFRNISTQGAYENKTTAYNASEITAISLNNSNEEIKIVSSDDEDIHLDYWENEKEFFDIKVENGEIKIFLKTNKKWYEYIGFDFNIKKGFTVALPKNTTANLYFSTDNGKITMQDITLNGNAILKTSNGKIFATNLSLQNFNAQTSNGKLVLANVLCENVMDMHSSNGIISLENIEVGKSTILKTSNGKIVGTIRGKNSDFSIKSKTSNGKNNLPENFKSGEKMLDIHTSNGDIDIEMVE